MMKALRLIGIGLFLAAASGLIAGMLGHWNGDLDGAATLRPHFALSALGAGVLLVAVASRALGATSLLTGGVGLMLLGPAWGQPRPTHVIASAACRIETLRVAIANVESSSPRAVETLAAVRELDVDILATVETSRRFEALARSNGGPFRYWHRQRREAIWARRAIRIVPQRRPHGAQPPHLMAVVEIGGRRVGIAAIHMARPVVDRQPEQVAAFRGMLRDLPEDRILLGDFNAAPWTAAMHRIAREGGVEITLGFRITWRGRLQVPLIGRSVPTLLGAQIDHVLVSNGIGFRSVTTFPLPGSVHEGVLAELEVPGAGCAI